MNVNALGNHNNQIPGVRQAPKRATETSFQDAVQKHAGLTVPPEHKEHPTALTNSEKQYFEQMFPNAVDEIRTYNPYQRDGATSAAVVGSLFDRKG